MCNESAEYVPPTVLYNDDTRAVCGVPCVGEEKRGNGRVRGGRGREGEEGMVSRKVRSDRKRGMN